MNWSGASKVRERCALSPTAVRSGVSVAAGVQLARVWATVADETTGWLLVSHQVGLILMVGIKVPSIMSWEKATFWPYMLAGFMKDMGSRLTH